jgi:hypothetical protein
MPTLYVKDFPGPLYNKLKTVAEKDRRSVSAETIVLLEKVLEAGGVAGSNAVDSIINLRLETKAGPSVVELVREDRDR